MDNSKGDQRIRYITASLHLMYDNLLKETPKTQKVIKNILNILQDNEYKNASYMDASKLARKCHLFFVKKLKFYMSNSVMEPCFTTVHTYVYIADWIERDYESYNLTYIGNLFVDYINAKEKCSTND